MWAIRILSGPQAGQIYKLKNGKNRIGRAPNTDIPLHSQGISKEHLEVQVFTDKILISDLKSSNGTYINGIRIQNSLVRLGDKINAHNIMFEIVAAPTQQLVPVPQVPPKSEYQMVSHQNDQHMPMMESSHPQAPVVPSGPVEQILFKAKAYNDRVVLPGIYRMIEVFDFKFIVFGFAGAFVFLVTLLTVIPMKQITTESTQAESRRRALTVSRALAQANEKVIRSGDLSNFSVDFVLREDGIDDVYIVSKDGTIMAPPERAGSRPRQANFVKNIQGQIREVAAEVGIDKVAAAYPIVSFDAELQQNVPRAYAVVVFNTGSLQFDDGRAVSLFVQMLVIASLLGLIIFFLLYKLIEYPWIALKLELDNALRENRDQIQVNMKFPAVHGLLVNLNSLLVRALNPHSVAAAENSVNRDHEMKNLCDMVGYPTFILNRAKYIVTMNSSFQSLTGMNSVMMTGQSMAQIPDQALQKNIDFLTSQVKAQPQQVFSDSFEISGHQLKIHCQGFVNNQGEIDYYMITMTPLAQSEGGAA